MLRAATIASTATTSTTRAAPPAAANHKNTQGRFTVLSPHIFVMKGTIRDLTSEF